MAQDRIRRLPFLLVAFAIAAIVAVASAAAPVSMPVNTDDLVQAGPSPGLFVVSSGDVVGYLKPCG
jgi:hypothetical protein